MTFSKIAIADKQEILRLYCESDLSTAELSKQFGISISSTLRLLQEMMSPEEYREAVQKKQAKPKRQAKGVKKVVKAQVVQLDAQLDLVDQLGLELSHPVVEESEIVEAIANEPKQILLNSEKHSEKSSEPLLDVDTDNLEEFEQYSPEDVADDLVMDLDGDGILDIEDDEFEEDDEEDEEDEDGSSTISDPIDAVIEPVISARAINKILVILPLDQAELSNICYMVVDKASEIITRPMQDFKELGKVPSDEVNLLALPVFDNHRAARRFSAHNQKVIKFPGSLIHAAKSHLSQKGITRLLYGGQVFAL